MATVSGIAKHQGVPVSGAVIVVYKNDSDYTNLGQTTSASDGSWSVTGLAAQDVVVRQIGPAGFNDSILSKITIT